MIAVRDAHGRSATIGCARRGGGRCSPDGCGRRRARRIPGDPAGVLGDRSARGARPRLGGHPCVRRGHGLDLDDPRRGRVPARRRPDVPDPARCVADGVLSFVYKAAAEIGELGDNTRAMRAAVADDLLLRRALAAPDAETVLGHTRWASVGIISEPNAHPINSDELELRRGDAAPYVVGALNGDVDNHADLASRTPHPPSHHDRRQGDPGAREPATRRRRLRSGRGVPPHGGGVRGSVAIGASRRPPGQMLLALQRQRPRPVRRPRRRLLHRRQRAVRRRRGDRSLRSPRRRARRRDRRRSMPPRR